MNSTGRFLPLIKMILYPKGSREILMRGNNLKKGKFYLVPGKKTIVPYPVFPYNTAGVYRILLPTKFNCFRLKNFSVYRLTCCSLPINVFTIFFQPKLIGIVQILFDFITLNLRHSSDKKQCFRIIKKILSLRN